MGEGGGWSDYYYYYRISILALSLEPLSPMAHRRSLAALFGPLSLG